jgi:hypothetical protein
MKVPHGGLLPEAAACWDNSSHRGSFGPFDECSRAPYCAKPFRAGMKVGSVVFMALMIAGGLTCAAVLNGVVPASLSTQAPRCDPQAAPDAACMQTSRLGFAPPYGTAPEGLTAAMQTLDVLAIRAESDGASIWAHVGGKRIEVRLPGSGTLHDPFVIEGYHIQQHLSLLNTDSCFTIRGNYFSGHIKDERHDKRPGRDAVPMDSGPMWRPAQLRLNFAGPCIHVHDNLIGDLRVNQNIPRTGYATGGLIEENRISFIGQLRHFDGIFRANVVGLPHPAIPKLGVVDGLAYEIEREHGRIANVDGFNEGRFEQNVFHGSVDLDLHGHHHGTGFFAPSHYHGDDHRTFAAEAMDHSQRWHSVAFVGNTLITDGYGLRYEDVNHDGDDRMANSEAALYDTRNGPVSALNGSHVHRTYVEIADNRIVGAGIWVQVFNAPGRDIWLDADASRVMHFRDEAACMEHWMEEFPLRTGDAHPERTKARAWGRCDPEANPQWRIMPHPVFDQDASKITSTHLERNDGWLHITGNTVEVGRRSDHAPRDGIRLERVREADVVVRDNRVVLLEGGDGHEAAGIALMMAADARVDLQGNEIVGAWSCAVQAIRFEDVRWEMRDTAITGAKEAVCLHRAVPPDHQSGMQFRA